MKKLVVGGWWLVLGALCLLPGAAWAETQSVSYWDSKENVMKTQDDCERITKDTGSLKGGGWYYVEDEVNISHRLTIEKNDVHIILKDGANLVIHASADNPGISVCYESGLFLSSDSLYVYGQEKGTGRMEVHGGENAAGIGGICVTEDTRHMGNMYVYGGIIEAYGGKNAAGIGGSYRKYGNTVYAGDGAMDLYIYGGTVRAYGGEGAAGVGGANGDAKPSDLELYGGSLEATGGKNGGKGIGGGAGKGATCELESKYAAVWTDPSPASAFSIVDDDYDCTTTYVRMIAIHELVTGDTATFKRGKGYLVNSNVNRGTISVDGSAYLFLGKNSELTVYGDSVPGWYYKMAGLQVSPGNSIEIFGLEGGKLTASGGWNAAGIGGGEGGAGGTVTINSGTVTANGSRGAGIGGGYGGAGGTVTINGGTVTATGGEEAAGIGGGWQGSGGSVAIYGGVVTATGDEFGAGIGGGRDGAGGTVTIYGGTVKATGGEKGAGIGGGWHGSGGNVTINGGVVTATGGKDAPGIGDGRLYDGAGGSVTIVGGKVFATCSDSVTPGVVTRGSVSISGGVFKKELDSNWLADGYGVTGSSDPDYPYAVVPLVTLTVPMITGASVVVTVDGTVVKDFAGGALSVASTSAVTVDYTALDGWVLQGTTHFAATISKNLCLPAAGSEPTAIRLFTVTVPTVVGTTLEVKTNDMPVADFTGGSIVVLSNTVVTVDYAALEGWNIQGSTHFTAVVTGDLQLPNDDAKPFAGHPVAYMKRIVGKDGSVQFVKDYTNAIPVTAETEQLGNGWYYVVGSFTRSGIDVAAGCTANLILSDGTSLTAEGVDNCAGVDVCSGETLNIYCQEMGTGVLMAKGNWYGAGIGGGYKCSGGVVTINGGTVTAISDWCGAGIGGGRDGAGATVTINGGTVTATGGAYGAGIGGGYYGVGGKVTINGGTVTAIGQDGGKGIGGGNAEGGGSVEINGGTVRAEGYDAFGATVTLGECVDAYDITGGEPGTWIENKDDLTSVDKILAVHKIPTCAGGEIAKGAGGIWLVTPNEGVTAVEISDLPEGAFVAVPPTVTKVEGVADGQIRVYSGGKDITEKFAIKDGVIKRLLCTVTVGSLSYMTAVWTSDKGETNAVFNGSFNVPVGETGVTVIFTPEKGYVLIGEGVVGLGTVTDDITFGSASGYLVPAAGIPYLDWDAKNKRLTKAVRAVANCNFVANKTTSLANGGWYAVKGSVNISSKSLSVSGSAHLILTDGSSLTITGTTKEESALKVPEGSSLTIYGQDAGSGRLSAVGGRYSAGIGGSKNLAGGTVTINGGTVTATGGLGGAGIGGGDVGAGGTVMINGGTVTATGVGGEGNGGGAGIGGGSWGVGGAVTIRGGMVTAIGQDGGKGIGGGKSRNGGSLTIYGGTVRAEGSDAFGETVTLGEGVFAYDVTGGEPGTLIENKDGLTSVDKILTKTLACTDGEIVKVDGVWVVTPNTDAKAVTIENLPTGAKLAVKLNGYAVPSAAFIGFGDQAEGVFSLALNPEGVVNGVPVKPVLGAGCLVLGAGVSVKVATIPGLKYTLKRTDSLRRAEDVAPYQDWGEAGEPVIATGTTVTLEDPNPPADKAFYRVEVSAP